MLALLLLGVACLDVAFAALVVRADPHRWDNRVFAVLALLDAALSLVRAAAVFTGHGLGDLTALSLCAYGSVLLSWATIELAYSFPFNRPLPWRLRGLGLAWVTITLLCLRSQGAAWSMTYGEGLYFMPSFLIALYLLIRNYRRWSGKRTGIALIMGALVFRWAVAMATFNLGWRFGSVAFETCLWVNAVHVTIIGNVLMVYAVLRNHFFSVRGVLGELLLYVGFGLGIIGLTATSVEWAFHYAHNPELLRALLVAVALLPVVLVALARRFRAPVEDVLLSNLDPRRALRKSVLGRALESAELAAGDPEVLVAASCRALAEITLGGAVRYLSPASEGGELPAALAAHLVAARAPYLHRADALDLSGAAEAALHATAGDLFVPVRGGRLKSRRLFGVLAVSGGKIDHESMVAAVTLASHLALELENRALFAELEGSRHLAALGAFAAAIAHDIRTPLTSVQMSVQILRGKVELPADDMEYFDIALEELKRLNGHITEILDFAKPVKLHVTRLELRELVDDAAKAIAPQLRERNISLEQQHAEALRPVLADSQRMRQVLWNLLDNAAKASAAGSAIILRTRAAADGRIAVEVADSGRGIESGDLPRLFEPFFTTRADGTGLGLAICQKLVRAHAGEMLVRSTVGVGSTFTVLLPAA